MTPSFPLVRGIAFGLAWLALASWTASSTPANAHDETFPISGAKLTVKANGNKASRRFVFDAIGEDVIRVANHDPSVDGAQIVVVGLGKKGGSSGLINLPASNWNQLLDGEAAFKGYLYSDPAGSNGGVTKVVLKNKTLRVKAKGKKWKWKPSGKQEKVWIQFFFEQEQYCAAFDDGSGDVMDNEKGLFRARDAAAPGACLDQLCGNGRVEFGEECDDGNAVKKDGCRNDCTIGKCKGQEYDSTYAAIQNVIFDSPVYRCTNDACHGSAKEGNLDLRAGASYDQLINMPSDTNPEIARVFPSDPELSLLYEKVLAKAQDRPASNGSPMPVSAPALADEHIQGLRDWIRNAAPRDAVVIGTQDEFGTCLPPADPLKIDPPPRPDNGVQFRQTAWPLPAPSEELQGEDEICMATLYDFTGTDLVPENARVDCGEQFTRESSCILDGAWLNEACETNDDCEGRARCFTRNAINTTNECFAWDRQTLHQDPQSHHSIIFLYSGVFDDTAHQWGPWTYKFEDEDDPRNGETCDPTEIDPALGYNPGCSGDIVSTIACNVYGPPDATQLSLGGGGGTMPQFSGSQEPFYELGYPDGVFSALPMRGMIVWNSHAFNLTQKDTTMSQYLNLDFAPPEDQTNPSIQLFDGQWIFAQYVKPFETQEICGTSTFPQGTRLFQLSSHTHRWGVNFRIWEPPNAPCRPACPAPIEGSFFSGCLEGAEEYGGGDGLRYLQLPICGDPPAADPIYVSTDYSDPLNFTLPEVVELDSEDLEDRTYHFCSLYDNGSTPDSPPVKRHSTSPVPPSPIPIFEITGIGGPCELAERACMDGPNKGSLCHGTDEASFCETSDGAGDGECDACPVRGGVTTEDEMYIHLGNYYIESDDDE